MGSGRRGYSKRNRRVGSGNGNIRKRPITVGTGKEVRRQEVRIKGTRSRKLK